MQSTSNQYEKAGIRQQSNIVSLGLNIITMNKKEGSFQIETQCHPSETIKKILLNVESGLTEAEKREYDLPNRTVKYKDVVIYNLLHISDLELDPHQPIKLDLIK